MLVSCACHMDAPAQHRYRFSHLKQEMALLRALERECDFRRTQC